MSNDTRMNCRAEVRLLDADIQQNERVYTLDVKHPQNSTELATVLAVWIKGVIAELTTTISTKDEQHG